MAAQIKNVRVALTRTDRIAQARAGRVAVDDPALRILVDAEGVRVGRRGENVVGLDAHVDRHLGGGIADVVPLAIPITAADAEHIHTVVRGGGVVGVGAVGNGVVGVVNAVKVAVHIGDAVDLDRARAVVLGGNGVVVEVVAEAVGGHALVEVGSIFARQAQRIGRATRELTAHKAEHGLVVVVAVELVVDVVGDTRHKADILEHDGLHAVIAVMAQIGEEAVVPLQHDVVKIIPLARVAVDGREVGRLEEGALACLERVEGSGHVQRRAGLVAVYVGQHVGARDAVFVYGLKIEEGVNAVGVYVRIPRLYGVVDVVIALDLRPLGGDGGAVALPLDRAHPGKARRRARADEGVDEDAATQLQVAVVAKVVQRNRMYVCAGGGNGAAVKIVYQREDEIVFHAAVGVQVFACLIVLGKVAARDRLAL